jgi:Ca2+-binding RTX toxin-like protein
MRNIRIKNNSFRILTSSMIVAILLSAAFEPIKVEATCIISGDTTTCDGEDDAVTSSAADENNESVTHIVIGDGGNDIIYGGNADGSPSSVTDTLEGGDGNDVIIGGNSTGNGASIVVTLDGGPGNDYLAGSSGFGNNSSADNTIIGGEGDDYIHPGGDRLTTNNVDGGPGSDTVDYSFLYNEGSTGPGVTVDLSETGPQLVATQQNTDILSNVENLVGTPRDDNLSGTTGVNIIDGGSGSDVISGNGGGDLIFGGGGDDTISAHDGAFFAFGGDGNDSFTVSGQLGVLPLVPENAARIDGEGGANEINFLANTFGNIILAASSGTDTINFSQYNAPVTIDLSNTSSSQMVGTTGAGQLWITLNGFFSNVIGSLGFSNNITGNSLDNTLTGGNANDFLNGDGGSNVLNGGGGTDTDTGATPIPGGVINQSGTWISIEQPVPLGVVTETPVVTATPIVSETPAITETPINTETPAVTATPPLTPTTVFPTTVAGVTAADINAGGASTVIPVTGGLVQLTCDANSFQLPNGDIVTITGLCGNYWANIQSESQNSIPNLPAGASFVSSINVRILQADTYANLVEVNPLPAGARITLGFRLQGTGLNYKSLMLGGTGGWLELGNGSVIGQRYIVSTQQIGTAVLTRGQ